FDDRCISGDAWDGYATERRELMTYLKDQGIKNVVVLSGDIHASFAGVVMDNFEAATPQPVACELIAAGISSNSLFSFFEAGTRLPTTRPPTTQEAGLRGIITVDATTVGGPKFVENFNMLLLHGTQSAGTFFGAVAQGAPVPVARGAALQVQADATTNPHLKYVDTNAQ